MNLLFKPKILITFLIVISLLSILQITSRAEGWTDSQISDVQTKLFEITQNLDYQLQQLEIVANNTANTGLIESIKLKLYEIEGFIININNNVSDIEKTLNNIDSEIVDLNTQILNIYNALEFVYLDLQSQNQYYLKFFLYQKHCC